MTNESLCELKQEEEALQRWTGEGGSPWDAFGVMERIHAGLEHHRRMKVAAELHTAPVNPSQRATSSRHG